MAHGVKHDSDLWVVVQVLREMDLPQGGKLMDNWLELFHAQVHGKVVVGTELFR